MSCSNAGNPHEIVLGFTDVKTDGHCGFRALALAVGENRSQDDFIWVKTKMESKLRSLVSADKWDRIQKK